MGVIDIALLIAITGLLFSVGFMVKVESNKLRLMAEANQIIVHQPTEFISEQILTAEKANIDVYLDLVSIYQWVEAEDVTLKEVFQNGKSWKLDIDGKQVIVVLGSDATLVIEEK